MKIEISRVSENALIIYFADEIALDLVEKMALFSQAIVQEYPNSVYEVIPSYTSVLVEFHPLKVDVSQLISWCQHKARQVLASSSTAMGKLVTLPVYYHPEVAPDLESLAKSRKLSVDQVIELHSATEYTVCAIGFAPGFAFLGSVNEKIAAPRHTQPRLKVAKGSVGIADQQTAVYPLATPGGWQIVGNCPTELFNKNSDPMMPFEVGDKVRFQPVTREKFLQLGGVL